MVVISLYTLTIFIITQYIAHTANSAQQGSPLLSGVNFQFPTRNWFQTSHTNIRNQLLLGGLKNMIQIDTTCSPWSGFQMSFLACFFAKEKLVNLLCVYIIYSFLFNTSHLGLRDTLTLLTLTSPHY